MTLTKQMNSQHAIQELHKAFDLLNQAFYNNELPEPYIVITSTVKQKAYGWFTPNKIWTDASGEIEKHEIALSAEHMDRDYIDIIRTLHHEMIHLYCHTNEIKDTSRQGRYHNKNFKAESEKRGFTYDGVECDATHGWSFSQLTEETKQMIRAFNLDESAFKIARRTGTGKPKAKKPSSTVSYVCPSCEAKLRAKRGMNIVCGDCEETFEEQE